MIERLESPTVREDKRVVTAEGGRERELYPDARRSSLFGVYEGLGKGRCEVRHFLGSAFDSILLSLASSSSFWDKLRAILLPCPSAERRHCAALLFLIAAFNNGPTYQLRYPNCDVFATYFKDVGEENP
jgi:hypothetical protein